MRIAIFGVGGVGGYFGGRLAEAGNDVVFIARGENLKAMQSQGLKVESINGDFIIRPVQATHDPQAAGLVDIVLLAVKAWQVGEAAAAIRPMLHENSGVVWLGNGVDAPDQLAESLGAAHVIGGLTRISTTLAAPGTIRHLGLDPSVAFGEMDGRQSERVAALRRAFEACRGVTVETPADIQAAMWDKFVFIAAISGVGAVTRFPIGAIRSVPETRQMLYAALAEVTAVAHARGISLPADQAERTLAYIDGVAPGVTASMQRDIMEGRPSELEAQNGAVVRLGRFCGVPTPVHSLIYAALLLQEKKARGEI